MSNSITRAAVAVAVMAAAAAAGPSVRACPVEGRLAADVARGPRRGETPLERVLRPGEGVVRVVAVLREEDPALVAQLAAHGVVEVVAARLVQMRVVATRVASLAAVPGVARLRYPWLPSPKASSEGLPPMGIPPWQVAGWDGSGVKVGVLDTEFGGYQDHPDDLPVVDPAHRSWAASVGGPGEGGHGTACAEVLYDIAPGAEVYYASIGTDVELLEKLDWLAEQGVRVISSSIGFNNLTPMDGSSEYAQKIEQLWSQGILYVGPAGNEGGEYWTGAWQDSDRDGRHDYLSEWPNRLPLLVNDQGPALPSFRAAVHARWFEPWGGASTNLDIRLVKVYLTDPETVVQEVGLGQEPQDGDDEPLEQIDATVFGFDVGAGLFLEVRWVGGAPPDGLTLRIWASTTSGRYGLPEPYRVRAGSLAAPADAPHCLTVGAVEHGDLRIPAYSSEGPTDGGMVKPDLFGITDVSTETGLGFGGTSAAVPHVAGAAALLWSTNPSGLAAQEVWDLLLSQADPSVIRGGGRSFGTGLLVLGEPPAPPAAEPAPEGGPEGGSSPPRGCTTGRTPGILVLSLLVPWLGARFRRRARGWGALLALAGAGCPEHAPPVAADVAPAAAEAPEPIPFDPEHVLEVRVTLDPPAWDALRFERPSLVEVLGTHCDAPIPDAFHDYPAQLVLDGTALGKVGLSGKGMLGSINPARPSLKVKLGEYQPSLRHRDLTRLVLNNQNHDPTRMRACLAYRVFEAMGVPAPRCSYARLFVQGRDLGVYAQVEPIGRPFLARAFGDDTGNLYEGQMADLQTGLTARLEKKTHLPEADWSDVAGLIAAIESPDAELLGRLDEVLDLDAFFAFWVTEAMVGHADGFSNHTSNYYLYRDPGSGKFRMIPWGADDTFWLEPPGLSGKAPRGVYARALLARRLYQHADGRARFEALERQLLAERWDAAALLAEVGRVTALLEPHRPSPQDEALLASQEELESFIAGRRGLLMEELEGGVPPLLDDLITEDAYCLSYEGDLDLNLETTWSSIPPQTSFSSGTGTMGGTYPDLPGQVPLALAIAGRLDGVEGGFETVVLAGTGHRKASRGWDFDEYWTLELVLPVAAVQPGAPVAIDGHQVSGYLWYEMPPWTKALRGPVAGEIVFDGATSTVLGGPVKAHIHAQVWTY